MPYVRHYRNVFDPSEVDERFEPKGQSVISLAPKGFHGIAERNGVRIGKNEWSDLCVKNDQVTFLSTHAFDGSGGGSSGGGGGTGSHSGSGGGGFGGPDLISSLILYAAQAVIVFGLGLAAQALAPRPKTRSLDTNSVEDVSGTKRFTGAQTSAGSGQPIPIIFGTVRAGGHIIESFNQVKFSAGLDEDDSGVVRQPHNNSGLDSQVAVGAETLNTRLIYCHGPIESMSELRIDGNPIENVPGIAYELNSGTKVFDRPPLGFDERKDERSIVTIVNTEDGAVTERTTQPVKAFEVGLLFTGGLYDINSEGNRTKRKVKLKVEYREVATPELSFTELETIEVSASNRSPVDVWVRLTTPYASENILDIRVTRLTADSTDTSISDVFVWNKLVEVRGGKRVHPGVAQAAFRQVPQEQTAVPRDYTAKISGLNDIRVYSDESTYTEEFTNNPAWCFLRWLTDNDFGPGRYYSYEENVDLPAFIDWANFCNESVPDGRGGYHNRCQIDVEFRNTTSSSRIIEIFAQAGDADIINQSGTWTVLPHRDTPVMKQLDEGSYKKDSLSVNYLSLDERPAAITGTFINQERDYKSDSITQVDREIAASAQSIPPEKLNLIGITRPSQIQRTLDSRLNFVRIADETITAEFGLSAISLKVGDVVKLSTATAAHGIVSGSILATNQIEITLDREFLMEASKSYEISVPNGDSVDVLQLVSPDEDETTSLVRVNNVKWSSPIFPGMTYAIGELQDSTELFRVTNKTLNRQYNSQMTLHKYSTDIFDNSIEVDPVESFATVPDPRLQPNAACKVGAVQRDSTSHGSSDAIQNIDVTWCAPSVGNSLVAGYRILWREKETLDDSTNTANFFFSPAGFTDGIGWTITDVADGTYEIRVDTLARNGASHPSEIAEIIVA